MCEGSNYSETCGHVSLKIGTHTILQNVQCTTEYGVLYILNELIFN